MNRTRLVVPFAAGLMLSAALAHAGEPNSGIIRPVSPPTNFTGLMPGIVPLQLAGPPSEFSKIGQLQPIDAAIYSKTALLPIELSPDANGIVAGEMSLPMETSNPRFLVFSGPSNPWNTDMRSPSGRTVTSAESLAKTSGAITFGIGDGDMRPAQGYTFEGIEKGNWSVKFSSSNPTLGKSLRRGMILLEGDPSTGLVSHETHWRHMVGESIGFVGKLEGQTTQGVAPSGKAAGRIDSAMLRVTTPTGDVLNLPMYDDGKHSDGAAGDGVYGGDFLADQAGEYDAQVVVRGTNLAGDPMVRTAEHMVPIVEPSLRLSDTKATASIATDTGTDDAERLYLNVPVAGEKPNQHYRGYAEVWGTNSMGVQTPVAWVSGMVVPHNGVASFGLDTRWIALAGAQAPFELRRLTLEDPDVHTELAGAERLPITVPTLGNKAAPSEIVVDEAMRTWAPPAALAAQRASRAPDSDAKTASEGTKVASDAKTLLVHGYCSSDIFRFDLTLPYLHTLYLQKFWDLNANRTNDVFAQEISWYGSGMNRMPVLAHSQGGLASLHSAVYYSWPIQAASWNGRRIQSFQSPFHGTNVAGILASLGRWVFGVGCGSNYDLTYSGAAQWIRYFTPYAFSFVTYITTSNSGAPCSYGTDWALQNPDDGVIERNVSQLAGAYSDGHAIGWCHARGMNNIALYDWPPYMQTLMQRASY